LSDANKSIFDFTIVIRVWIYQKKIFRIRKSKKDRQDNG